MKRSDSVIAVLSGDAGGANALAPVIAALQDEGRYRVRALAYRQARIVWNRRGLSFDELAEAMSTEDAASILRQSKAAFLLTGTSVNGIDLEKRFIEAARSLDIPSLALMDFWSNYAGRFANETGAAVCLPDCIAVMDERAREEMVAAGFDSDCLVITGQPAFDDVLNFRQQFTPARHASVRALLKIAPDERMVLFASQPLAALSRDNSLCFLDVGYTEQTVLDALVAALERIAQRTGQKIALVIRPHPRERAADLEFWQSRTIRILVSTESEGREVALASDLVTGMTTVLLIEACLMGCMVVSLQPGLRSADILPTNSAGFSRAVYDESEIEPIIERLLFDEVARKEAITRVAEFRLLPNATWRVIRLIDSIQRSYQS
jgi:hypothetical protein